MKSQKLGKNTSEVEILNISKNGVWILIGDREYFLPFQEFPWFKSANISEIHNVKLIHQTHLHWPDLDVDLDIKSFENIESYPLISKE